MMASARAPQNGGFTLIEVLIAILVLSIGLLGLAALQISGLQNGQQSYQRAQASALAYDIADRMRANRAVAAAGGYTVAMGALPSAAASPDCSTATCSATQLAAWDIANWALRVKSTLTNGDAVILCTACASGTVQAIIVSWQEKAAGAAGLTTESFRIYVSP